MRIAVFADIHSNYLVFKKAFDQTKTMNIDKYIFLGDYVTDGFDGNKILDIIRDTNGYAINGNREVSIIDYHKNKTKDWDKYIQWNSMKYGYECLNEENVQFIESLNISKIIDLENRKVCLSHSTPYNVRGDVFQDSYEIFDKLITDFNCDIYLFGHEHKNYCTFYKNKYFINPGSIGMPTYELPYKYGILSIDEEKTTFETINVDYEYLELDNYYTNSEYYRIAKEWCSLLLMSMKDGQNHPDNFINLIRQNANKNNVDISKNIPNDLFLETFNQYVKNTNVNIPNTNQ